MPLPQLSLHQTPDAMVNVPSCVPPERPKPIVMLHVSHTGGTFLCNQAKANCEAVWPDSLRAPVKTLDCNEPGMYGKVEAYLNCTTRRRLLARAGVTFSALERGFETGEFCPDDFDYIAMLRDPVDLIQSLLGSIGVAAEAVVEAIRAIVWCWRTMSTRLRIQRQGRVVHERIIVCLHKLGAIGSLCSLLSHQSITQVLHASLRVMMLASQHLHAAFPIPEVPLES